MNFFALTLMATSIVAPSHAGEQSMFPVELVHALGFSVEHDRDLGQVVRSRHGGTVRRFQVHFGFAAKHHALPVKIEACAQQAVDEPEDIAHGTSILRAKLFTVSGGTVLRSCPSRLPAGLHAASWLEPSHLGIVVLDAQFEHAQVTISTTSPRINPECTEAIRSAISTVERAARILLARVVARRYDESDSQQLGGSESSQFRCRFSARLCLDLAEWAAARGWAVGKPDSLPSVTLTKEGREILLPLAAMQARVDGEWRELGDCVAEKDGRWLVPATIDDLAR